MGPHISCYTSYNWQLAKLVAANDGPIFDYIFLDGAHTFAVDALTFFLCDKLLKIGGYIDFDDYNWTLRASPSLRPERFPLTAKLYTREQIDTPQVKMIIDLLVRKGADTPRLFKARYSERQRRSERAIA